MNNIDASEKKCSGCAACINICPKKAILYKKNDQGFYEAKIDKKKCINCGLCKKVCGKFSTTEKKVEDGKLISAYTKNSITRYATTSGGIAYEIAKWGLEKKYIVVGTEYNIKENIANTILVENIENLNKLKGSKYLQTKTDEAITKIIDICKKNSQKKFIIFGTPCQIYGYKKVIEFYRFKNEFIYIDLFCHGVPSYNIWEAFLTDFNKKHKNEKIVNVNFRSKKNKWHNFTLEIETNKKKYYMKSERNTFYKIFFDNIYLNHSCYECELRKKISVADIRLGDFWGKKYSRNLKGISAVNLLTKKGEEIIKQINNDINIEYDENIKEFLKYQSTKDYKKNYSDNELKDITKNSNLSKIIKKYRKNFPLKYRIKENLKVVLSYFPVYVKNLIRIIK